MKVLEKRLDKLEAKHPSESDLDFSKLTDEEVSELNEIAKKTGENEDYSLLSDEELNRIIELCDKAEI